MESESLVFRGGESVYESAGYSYKSSSAEDSEFWISEGRQRLITMANYFEKLSTFFLGEKLDSAAGKINNENDFGKYLELLHQSRSVFEYFVDLVKNQEFDNQIPSSKLAVSASRKLNTESTSEFIGSLVSLSFMEELAIGRLFKFFAYARTEIDFEDRKKRYSAEVTGFDWDNYSRMLLSFMDSIIVIRGEIDNLENLTPEILSSIYGYSNLREFYFQYVVSSRFKLR